MSRLLVLLLASGLSAAPVTAAQLEIARPIRHWEFMDAVGSRAAMLGTETGRFEAWVYPLKILDDFHLSFTLNRRPIPAESVARSVIYRPGSVTLIYSGDYYAEHFLVRDTFIVPPDTPGILIRLDVESSSQLEIEVSFRRVFQLMWPAGLGGTFGSWDKDLKSFLMGEERHRFFALVGSPDASLKTREYGTNYSVSSESSFALGPVQGKATKVIAIAASFDSREKLIDTYHKLILDPGTLRRETARYYDRYLEGRVRLQLVDKNLQKAYDWSLLSMRKALVENPFLRGRGLVAGFGLSKGEPRPGFAWFFGRDTFWGTLALTSAGDFETARDAIDFIAQFQRDDGKIPHEIAQSSNFVPWFEEYPYAFASADATPLFIISVRDYVQSSGDVSLLGRNWPRLKKALKYLKSTYDSNGFAKNLGVGHGWVEGGPLHPIRPNTPRDAPEGGPPPPVKTELYQAGIGLEALRSMAQLARYRGETDLAKQLEKEFSFKQKQLSEIFWVARKKSYGFALNEQNEVVDEPSILATVPMWFGLLDPLKARKMIQLLADEAYLSDWGSRLISSRSPLYRPAGYHSGTVWPLFSGWAAVGQYRYHQSGPAYANLRANAQLALQGSGGNTTEVLSGAVYSPLSTSSSHQTWSAAMVISPLIRGLLGLQVNVMENYVILTPHLPADWKDFGIQGVPLKSGTVDFRFRKDGTKLHLEVENHGQVSFRLEFAPAFAPSARITRALVNGQGIHWTGQAGSTDWHPLFKLQVARGTSILVADYERDFGFFFSAPLPLLGEASSNLKVISESWNREASSIELVVSGLPEKVYRLGLMGGKQIAAVEGAALSKQADALEVRIPSSSSIGYAQHSIRVMLKMD